MMLDDSPQRPHCLTIFVGSFWIGLLAAATACSAWALSSALLSAGPERRFFIGRTSPLDVVSAAWHGDLHFATEGGGHIPGGNDDFGVGIRFDLTSIILVAGRLF